MDVHVLADKAKKGDWQAFLQLALAKKDRLYHRALAMMQNEEDAADAVEEALLKAYSAMAGLNEPQYFQSWLTRILIHTCIDMHRKASKTVYLVPERLERGAHSPQEDLADRIDLERHLGRLSDDYRTVLVLRYYEDLKIDEIARLLNLPPGTVKSRINYALKKLQRAMGGGRANEM